MHLLHFLKLSKPTQLPISRLTLVFFLVIMAKTRAPKRAAAAAALEARSTPKRSRSKSDNASQAFAVDTSQPHSSLRPSPRKALVASQAIEPPTFELELRDLQVKKAIIPPADGSKAATIATTEAADEAADELVDELFEGGIADNLNGITWERLHRFCKPGSTLGPRMSWIF